MPEESLALAPLVKKEIAGIIMILWETLPARVLCSGGGGGEPQNFQLPQKTLLQ